MTWNRRPLGSNSKSGETRVSNDGDSTINSHPKIIRTNTDGDSTIDSCVQLVRSENVDLFPTLKHLDFNARSTVLLSDHLIGSPRTSQQSDKSLAPPSVSTGSFFEGPGSLREYRRCSSIGQLISKLNCYRKDNMEKSYTTLGTVTLSAEQQQLWRTSAQKKRHPSKQKPIDDDDDDDAFPVEDDSFHQTSSIEEAPLLRGEQYEPRKGNRRMVVQHIRSMSVPHLKIGNQNKATNIKETGRRKSTMALF